MQVILGQKAVQQTAGILTLQLARLQAGVITAIAEIAAAANGKHLYAAYPLLHRGGDYIEIPRVGADILFFLDAPQAGDLIAIPGL
jgi:hypothetical protein